VNLYPDFDDNLRQSFRRETELFFDSIVHEDRSILDLLTADYTFVNGGWRSTTGFLPGIPAVPPPCATSARNSTCHAVGCLEKARCRP
jgi:hypothetical protein